MTTLALGPVIGKIGGSGVIVPAEPVPLQADWRNLGEIRVTKLSRAILYAQNVTSDSASFWNEPYPRMRWREATTGETHEHEFPRKSVGADQVFLADLGPGTWAAGITGFSDRTNNTYNITAAAAPLS